MTAQGNQTDPAARPAARSVPGLHAAVIIPHYNDAARLLRCLAALMPQVGASSGTSSGAGVGIPKIEVLVVDNGSTQSLDAVRAAHPDLRIVTEPRTGAAMARNRGVAETTAPRLFFLDCDCVPDPDWLAQACRVADLADMVGGTITVFDETPPPRSGAQAYEAVFAFDNKSYIERRGFSVTANLLTSRAVFLAVGDFVPGLSEDIDWCNRARARGFRLIHAPGLRAGHPSRGDWAALERKWHRVTRELFGLTGRGPAARLRWGLRGLAMLPVIALHAPRALRSPALSGATERGAALATLARLHLRRSIWMLRQALGGQI